MATADAPTPIPGRASDADREQFVDLLKVHWAEGRLSTDTLARRLEAVLGARSVAELDELVADVRQPGPLRTAAINGVAWLSTLVADIESAWRTGRMPTLALPAESMTIGRAADCDCHLAEPSVSRHHARVRRVDHRWLLLDLGSRNGTRLNGARVSEETEVRPGDQLDLGGVRYRLRAL